MPILPMCTELGLEQGREGRRTGSLEPALTMGELEEGPTSSLVLGISAQWPGGGENKSCEPPWAPAKNQ